MDDNQENGQEAQENGDEGDATATSANYSTTGKGSGFDVNAYRSYLQKKASTRKSVTKVRTYIQKLDTKLNGGIPKKHILLVCGQTGVMKSTLCYNILFSNARRGSKGVYFTFNQPEESFEEQMSSSGMDVKAVGEKIRMRSFEDFEGEDGDIIDVFKKVVKEAVDDKSYDLLVIDTFDILKSLAGLHGDIIATFNLFRWFREMEQTVFLVMGSPYALMEEGGYPELSMCDGLMELTTSPAKVDGNINLQVLKMRNCKFTKELLPLKLAGGKISVISQDRL